ncbi:uncharacterized protein LOC131645948 [Vicia villosa]|uniref:uncharacterized protein LOC131645948 n=1 Tax=Vicia villosa TaxID=3911 RepID=UPI00273BFAA6|nr:uncharacterized protein LOC131645948 [Vicia villosa]
METKIPARDVTATKVLVIENAAEGASASPGFDAGPLVPGAGGEEVFGVGDEGEGAGEEVVEGEGVGEEVVEGEGDGEVFVEGDGAGAELGDKDRVGVGAGACCAMHEVANNPNIKNTLIATETILF